MEFNWPKIDSTLLFDFTSSEEFDWLSSFCGWEVEFIIDNNELLLFVELLELSKITCYCIEDMLFSFEFEDGKLWETSELLSLCASLDIFKYLDSDDSGLLFE